MRVYIRVSNIHTYEQLVCTLEGVLKRALKKDVEQELAKTREKEEEHAKEKKKENRFGSTRAVAASSTLAKDKTKTNNHPGQPTKQVVVLCFSQAQIELICSVLLNAANLKRFFFVPTILLLPLFFGKGKYREVIHIYIYICVCVCGVYIYIYIYIYIHIYIYIKCIYDVCKYIYTYTYMYIM